MMRKRQLLSILALFSSNAVFAQTNGVQKGAAALSTLSGDLELYLDPVTNVVYAVAMIVGVIGAFKVFSNWQQGKDNVMSGAMGWFGSMLFILVANTVVRAMFL